ncbi:MAG: MBL fold metallo-hydrolase, partial [Candidatus Nanohaloarchaea archaeon]|nr:MBL fold metallo-hydrolase [Candidatus Nanohaloarchaea archaeon]
MRVHQYEDDHQVYRLDLGWPEPFVSNAYLVDDGEVTLIDSGYPYNQRSIQDELGKAGYAVEDIDQVLLTHYDLDHVGGLSRIADELDAPIYMGRDDLELMQGDEDPPLLHHKGMFHRIAREAYELPGSLEFRAVDDGEELGGFTALHTPGHNPGHIAYIHEDTGA